MKSLKDAIEQKGLIISDEVLKVDSFLNHQIDCPLVMEMADEFYEHFKDKKITKIVTIESSGVAPSFATACRFGVPMVFIKKHNQARCKIQSAVRYSLSQRTNTIQSAWKDNIYLKKTMYYSSMTFWQTEKHLKLQKI